MQLNSCHYAQGFLFYNLICLVSEGFLRGAFPQVIKCNREDCREAAEILPHTSE